MQLKRSRGSKNNRFWPRIWRKMGEIWLLKWAILANFGAKMAISDQSELGTLPDCVNVTKRNSRIFREIGAKRHFSLHWNSIGCVGLYSDVSKVGKVKKPGRHFDKRNKISAWLNFQPNRTSLRGGTSPFYVTRWFYYRVWKIAKIWHIFAILDTLIILIRSKNIFSR